MPTSIDNTTKPSQDIFPVVGIGASAGGLEAYRQLLKTIPESSGIAYILVQHLDPTHESMLPEILSKVTPVPVHQIINNIHLAPDNIYIVPSNKLLVATDGVLQLKPRGKDKKNRPIDHFFTSLGEVHKEMAIGIVLSGTGSDGTPGLQAIKEHGGITIVQDPESAVHDGMPRSAIDAMTADFILPVEEIVPKILELRTKHSGFLTGESGEDEVAFDETTYRQILSLLRIRKQVDFVYYKPRTIKRRIARRMAISSIVSHIEYLNFLTQNTGELDVLYEDLLIPVTNFFRDPKSFDQLKEKVFPVITAGKSATQPLRIWSAGCSTGQEAYSLAISLYEYLGHRATGIKIQVFGTDISEKSINVARAGVYSLKQLEDFSPTRLQQFFTRIDGHYQVAKFIRDMCIFASHNFLKDPPFAKLDLVCCRNVLIYMESFLQKKALGMFHYALLDKGFLLLGKSETTSIAADHFTTVDKHEKIYSKKNTPTAMVPVSQRKTGNTTTEVGNLIRKPVLMTPDFQKSADEILLMQFTPAGVIIDDHSDIVHFHGDTGPFLTPSPGRATFNLLKMARQGLGFELRNCIHKAKSKGTLTTKEAIDIDVDGKKIRVSLTVIPLPRTIEPYYLVLFRQTSYPLQSTDAINDPAMPSGAESDPRDLRIRQLEQELLQSREDMRAITHDQEAINEELQSANEELLSGSEELQSLNEELETSKEELESSKEELQSSNEELTVANQELQSRNIEINDARNYADAIITTVREPLIILNRHLQIRTANQSFFMGFGGCAVQKEGKLLYEIGNHQWDIPELRTLLRDIIPKQVEVTDFEVTLPFPLLGERTMLLNASLIKREIDREPLILLAIEDITERKLAERRLESLNRVLEIKVLERTKEVKEINKNLQQSNIDLMQFAHIASHDLKEPLRKIKTFAARLRDDAETQFSQKGDTYLSKVEHSSERLLNMIEDILNYSKLNATDNLVENVELTSIIKNIESDLEVMIQQKNASISYESPPQIEGAPVLIYQLFYNLIHNSLKFSRSDVKQEITIQSKMITLENEQFVKITIADKGIGFETNESEKIFSTFTRLNAKEQYEGTGLGLTLCKRIVERHGGSITADGSRDRGAVFTIILPRKQKSNHI